MFESIEVKDRPGCSTQPDHDHVIGRLAISFDRRVFEVEAEIHADP